MPLVPSTLASGLENMSPQEDEAPAADALASAWKSYFEGASIMGKPIETGALESAVSAFRGGLSGMSSTGAGAAAISTAVTAFWGVLVGAAATAWVLSPNVVVTVTPPPGLGGLAGAIQSAFTASAANKDTTLSQAANSLATAMHTGGGVGALAIVQPPPPAPPVTVPVL